MLTPPQTMTVSSRSTSINSSSTTNSIPAEQRTGVPFSDIKVQVYSSRPDMRFAIRKDSTAAEKHSMVKSSSSTNTKRRGLAGASIVPTS